MQRQAVRRNTLFIVGDSQVGKTTIVRHLFEPRPLSLVASLDGATEYQVLMRGSEFPMRIMEIRSHDFIAKNAIDFDTERDVIFFCYAIDDPDSFEHVVSIWIPSFKEQAGDEMSLVLIGHKEDIRYNDEVIRNLAERVLKPVSDDEPFELCYFDKSIDVCVESSIGNFEELDEVFVTVCESIFKRN